MQYTQIFLTNHTRFCIQTMTSVHLHNFTPTLTCPKVYTYNFTHDVHIFLIYTYTMFFNRSTHMSMVIRGWSLYTGPELIPFLVGRGISTTGPKW